MKHGAVSVSDGAFTPREHQRVMIDFMLRNPRCAVWADMGMGKTSAALSVLHTLALLDDWPALVVAPRRVAAEVWPHEAARWFPGLRVRPIIGSREEREAALAGKRADIYTINYENLQWLTERARAANRWPWRTVIADESTRLKNFRLKGGGKRARALAAAAHTHCVRWVNLTGTPAPNGLLDLWGQTWFLDRGERLGRTYTEFVDRWFAQNAYDYTVTPRPGAAEQIAEVLRGVCLTIKADDWFPTEKPLFNTVEVELPSRARKLYRDMERKLFAELGGEKLTATSAAARTLKCLQMSSGAAYVDQEAGEDTSSRRWAEIHTAKLEALESIISEAAGEPVLVAYHFRSTAARIKAAFPGARMLDHDPRTIEEWNEGRIPVLLAHPASAGHGLNLQDGGRRLVFFDHWWALEEYQQMIERIGPVRQRQAGHPRPVFVTHIVARDTLDELVVSRRAGKDEVQNLVRDYARRHKHE